MKNLPELVYKTTSPFAIAWWRELNEINKRQHELRTEFVKEVTELYGPSPRLDYAIPAPHKRETRELWVRGGFVYAIDCGHGEQPPADSGWRLDSKSGLWMPKLATKAGKAWRDRLETLNLTKLENRIGEVGITSMAVTGNYMFRPGVRFDEETETLYNTWGSSHVAEEVEKYQEKAPEVTWEREKLSTYIAWLEEQDKETADV